MQVVRLPKVRAVFGKGYYSWAHEGQKVFERIRMLVRHAFTVQKLKPTVLRLVRGQRHKSLFSMVAVFCGVFG
jgi:hypothetical protein